MSDLRIEFVRKKLKGILFDLKELKTLDENPELDFTSDEKSMTLAERRVERIINHAISINLHLIRSSNAPSPDDYTKSFTDLAKIKILPSKLANNLAPSAGFRNLLIHEYDEVKIRPFESAISDTLKYFPDYVDVIEKYISSQEK